jgi:YggT family protein
MFVFADARGEVADFLGALLGVYTLCIVGYVVMNLVFALGARMPYSRPLRAVMDFLSDVSEPFLRIFRRLGLQIGPLDLTPMVAIIVLQIVGGIIVNLVRG